MVARNATAKAVAKKEALPRKDIVVKDDEKGTVVATPEETLTLQEKMAHDILDKSVRRSIGVITAEGRTPIWGVVTMAFPFVQTAAIYLEEVPQTEEEIRNVIGNFWLAAQKYGALAP